jgi:hypothetical protein
MKSTYLCRVARNIVKKISHGTLEVTTTSISYLIIVIIMYNILHYTYTCMCTYENLPVMHSSNDAGNRQRVQMMQATHEQRVQLMQATGKLKYKKYKY